MNGLTVYSLLMKGPILAVSYNLSCPFIHMKHFQCHNFSLYQGSLVGNRPLWCKLHPLENSPLWPPAFYTAKTVLLPKVGSNSFLKQKIQKLRQDVRSIQVLVPTECDQAFLHKDCLCYQQTRVDLQIIISTTSMLVLNIQD